MGLRDFRITRRYVKNSRGASQCLRTGAGPPLMMVRADVILRSARMYLDADTAEASAHEIEPPLCSGLVSVLRWMFAAVREQHLRSRNHPARIRPSMSHLRTAPAGLRGDPHSKAHRWHQSIW